MNDVFNVEEVLGVIERVFESPRGSVQRSAFDLDDTTVPARFEDLAVKRRCCTALAESEIRLWWWPRYVRA